MVEHIRIRQAAPQCGRPNNRHRLFRLVAASKRFCHVPLADQLCDRRTSDVAGTARQKDFPDNSFCRQALTSSCQDHRRVWIASAVPSGSAPASGKATGPPPRPGPCSVMRPSCPTAAHVRPNTGSRPAKSLRVDNDRRQSATAGYGQRRDTASGQCQSGHRRIQPTPRLDGICCRCPHRGVPQDRI